MTERKPPGTSWETWIEAQIRVAREQGAFDNLPGAGKPLPYLGQEYDPDWWATVRRRVSALNVEIAKVNATVLEGPPTRLSTLDVDQVVTRWRRTRSANPSGSSPVSRPAQSDTKR
jgi:DnaJ homologue, subfamily C, member 28, conserved domain